MGDEPMVFGGIKGTAIAFDRATGRILWETFLKGSGFVHLVLDGDNLYATTQGEIFCLNPKTGQIRWRNPMKGYGLGIMSIAVAGGGSSVVDLAAEQQSRDQQAQSQIATGSATNLG
jgi:outer membrane protein assembly factor BamB